MAVAQLAYLECGTAAGEPRGSPRKTLRLSTDHSGATDSAQVIVHDISETGLLLETALELGEGEAIDVVLPGLGERRVTVAWSSGRFFGCQLAEYDTNAAGSFAERAGMDALPSKGSPEAVSLAAHQLHELSQAIERISCVLDRAMDQLGKRDR